MNAPAATLDVLFRTQGDEFGVTAVFPSLPETGGLMVCYAHIGQHSACSEAWYAQTSPATPAEYAPLLRELRQIYETGPDEPVKLRVVQRRTAKHRRERLAELRRIERA